MNRILTLSAIVLVAVIMGMSAVAPMIPQAEANHPCANPPPEPQSHACVGGSAPSCAETADQMRAGGAPEQAIQRFLDHCVD